MKAQERQIKLLREEVDRLKFRKDLKLEVPLNTPKTLETQSLRNTRSIPTLTPPAGRNLIPSPSNAKNAPSESERSSRSVPVMMTPSTGRNGKPSSAMKSSTGSLIPSPSNTGDAGTHYLFAVRGHGSHRAIRPLYIGEEKVCDMPHDPSCRNTFEWVPFELEYVLNKGLMLEDE